MKTATAPLPPLRSVKVLDQEFAAASRATIQQIVNIITFIFPWLPMAHFPVSNEKVANSGAF